MFQDSQIREQMRTASAIQLEQNKKMDELQQQISDLETTRDQNDQQLRDVRTQCSGVQVRIFFLYNKVSMVIFRGSYLHM